MKEVLYGVLGVELLFVGFYLWITWKTDELWFVKVIIMLLCLILGLALVAVQLGMFERATYTDLKPYTIKLS